MKRREFMTIVCGAVLAGESQLSFWPKTLSKKHQLRGGSSCTFNI
jgi:hypothetical protein